MHSYTHAVMGITYPVTGELYGEHLDEVNIEALRAEVEGYKRVLREINLEVIEVETRGKNIRDKLVVEDLAVVSQGIAILPRTKDSSASMIANSKLLDRALSKCGLKVVVLDAYSKAKIAPADVLFTGREIFVGISELTNEAGANVVASTYPEFPCTPVKMPEGALPLKRYITVAGQDILSVSDDPVGQELLRKIEREAGFSYQTLTVPTIEASNVVFANNTLLHKGIEDIGDESFKVFCDRIDFPRRSLKFTELSKLPVEVSTLVLLLKLN